MSQVEVELDRPGRSALRVTPDQDSLRFSSRAVGGFDSASFRLTGDPRRWKREVSFLATVRLILDTLVVWEGRVEDITLIYTRDSEGAEIDCLGFQRLLDDVSVRRLWSQRDFDWRDHPGSDFNRWDPTFGNISDTDPTKIGVRFSGNGSAVTNGDGIRRVKAHAPQGMTWVRLLGRYEEGGTPGSLQGQIRSSADGTTITTNEVPTADGNFDTALNADARIIYLGVDVTASFTNNENDFVQYINMRALGTSLTEDEANGFYGGTILRDLISLVPGLTPGMIEEGDDFVIEAMERAVRSPARSVVDEVASYYTRYWAVWEDATFEWMAHHLDEPNWLTVVGDCAQLELHGTIDGTCETVYVLYTDADNRDKEKTASSADQRNPWVRQGKTRHEVIDLGALVARGHKRKVQRRRTGNLAQQRANRLVADLGRYPAVEGTIVIAFDTLVKRANGGPVPAYMIRGGETIAVTDLPKSDIFSSGRDGETLFHIVSAEADAQEGLVTLEIEGQTSRSDVILARLAALTRQ